MPKQKIPISANFRVRKYGLGNKDFPSDKRDPPLAAQGDAMARTNTDTFIELVAVSFQQPAWW
jgi:hypothetical protein